MRACFRFIVRAVTLNDGSSVTIDGLSFSPGTAGFHVYRGNSPAQLSGSHRIRRWQRSSRIPGWTRSWSHRRIRISTTRISTGGWNCSRRAAATIHGTVDRSGNDALQMTENRYRGMIVRITRGRGAGQERQIAGEHGDRVDGVAGMGGGAGCEQLLRGGRERVAVWSAGKEQPGAIRGAEPRRARRCRSAGARPT